MIRSDFSKLRRYFAARSRALTRAGQLPYRQTARGAWASSRLRELNEFFQALQLDRYRLLIDLGSGDGIVVCLAALFTRAVGIEVDGTLCRLGAKAAGDLGLGERARFIQADYATQRFSSADCLYLYPDKPIYAIETLLRGWPGDLLVYGPHFRPLRMKTVRRLESGRERLVVYRNEGTKE